MTTITPFLWFDDNAEQAVERYLKVFDDAELVEENRLQDGKLFIATIRLQGQTLTLMNGGPDHKLTDAFSLSVSVETQDEVDTISDAADRGRRRAGPLRLARRRVRALVAGRPDAADAAAERPGSREGRPHPGRHDADEAPQPASPPGSARRRMSRTLAA